MWDKEFMAEYYRLNPMLATQLGYHEYDHVWGDFSPQGIADQYRFLMKWRERVQCPAASKWIETQLEGIVKGEQYYDIRIIDSTFKNMMMVLSITPEPARTQRRRALPKALQQYISFLRKGLQEKKICSKRQVQAVIKQLAMFPEGKELQSFLQNEYLPLAPSQDGVGYSRYNYYMQLFTGTKVTYDSLVEFYNWGWTEIKRLDDAIRRCGTTKNITVSNEQEFFNFLNAQETRAMQIVKPLFDIPDYVSIPELKSSPLITGDVTYSPPAADFSRNGYITYPQKYPRVINGDMTTAFHEGFPGHHLQLCLKVANKDLNDVKRLLVAYPVYEEGWALYAEQLMVDNGAYRGVDNAFLKGKYQLEMLRACRIVIDIGIHLGLVNPLTDRNWCWQQGVNLLVEKAGFQEEDAANEVTRYCGLPVQAICYKLGARKIAEYRKKWKGVAKSFHQKFLSLGVADLDTLDEVFG